MKRIQLFLTAALFGWAVSMTAQPKTSRAGGETVNQPATASQIPATPIKQMSEARNGDQQEDTGSKEVSTSMVKTSGTALAHPEGTDNKSSNTPSEGNISAMADFSDQSATSDYALSDILTVLISLLAIGMAGYAVYNSFQQKPQDHTSPVSHSTAKKKFVSQVTAEGFPVSSLSDTSNEFAMVELQIKGDIATFVVNPNVDAQAYLIQNFSYSVGRVCDVVRQKRSPTQIVTVEPGHAKLSGDKWQVVSRAKVELR